MKKIVLLSLIGAVFSMVQLQMFIVKQLIHVMPGKCAPRLIVQHRIIVQLLLSLNAIMVLFVQQLNHNLHQNQLKHVVVVAMKNRKLLNVNISFVKQFKRINLLSHMSRQKHIPV